MKRIIKHLLICNHDATEEYYMCNHACNTTKEKSVKKVEEVNCKNCLRHLKKKNPYCIKFKFKIEENGN